MIDSLAAGGEAGYDLGDVSLHSAHALAYVVDRGTPVEGVSFRKADGGAVLEAAFALRDVMGAVAIIDTGAGDAVRAILPTDDVATIRAMWPW